MTRLSPLCLVILLAASRLFPASATPYERSALDVAEGLEQELRLYDEAMVEKKETPEATDDSDIEVESSLTQRVLNGCSYGGCTKKPPKRKRKQRKGKKQGRPKEA